MEYKFKNGDRVVWSYTHAIGRSRFRRGKSGTFSRCGKKLAIVVLDGNMRESRVQEDQLRLEAGDAK